MKKQFGGKITKALAERYAQSKHWDGEKFVNLEETSVDVNFLSLPKLLYRQICEREGREPGKDIPIIPFNKEAFLAPSQHVKCIWYGHSVLLLRVQDKTILIDPMLGPDAAPIAPFKARRFSKNSLDIIDALPEIDLLLLSHDHYDHLDYASMQKLAGKVDRFYVALGCARHLREWDIPAEKIDEFDWWDAKDFHEISITFTPSRHFSGRGLKDRAKSLWGGWVIKSKEAHLYFSGDGGYGKHFKQVGEKLGPFDFGFMESGQYNELWHQIHMYPEESIQAALDAGVKTIMPVHWGGFSLALHTWTDPIERFVEAARGRIEVVTPEIGELFEIGGAMEQKPWWKQYT